MHLPAPILNLHETESPFDGCWCVFIHYFIYSSLEIFDTETSEPRPFNDSGFMEWEHNGESSINPPSGFGIQIRYLPLLSQAACVHG
jgi:hypothetical protein